jgi:hypothetical protein
MQARQRARMRGFDFIGDREKLMVCVGQSLLLILSLEFLADRLGFNGSDSRPASNHLGMQ